MNRRYKITIVFFLFLAALLGMVYSACIQSNAKKVDGDNEKEIKYQTVIDTQKNLVTISSSSFVSQDSDEVFITLPVGTYENFDQGSVEFLRNDGKSMDILIPFTLNRLNIIRIPKTSITSGLYMVRISWINAQMNYYCEENLFLE